MLTVETGRAEERIAQLGSEIESLRSRLASVEERVPLDRATFCLLAGDYERVMATLMLAHMAAALEMEVTIFFTFWGVQAIRKARRFRGKPALAKALSAMLAPSIGRLPAGRFNFGGFGPVLFEQLMREKKIATPAQLLAGAAEAGIRLVACTTSMDVFGITPGELLPGISCRGAAEFMESASRSRVSFFV